MTVSGIGNAPRGYAAYGYGLDGPGANKGDQTQASSHSSQQASTVVTLSNGQTSSVTSSSDGLTGTPLSVAWAPQMFAKADGDNSSSVTAAEFGKLLAQAGLTSDQASALFSSFDTSQDGVLSVDEFVDGVQNQENSGAKTFDSLLSSIVKGSDGSLDNQATDAFLAQGSAVADRYWSGKR